jgi:hypothetical protein
MTIEAKIILDSVGEHSPRLTTFLLRHPKFIHAEFTRHRSMSLCVSSSRAVPVSKNLEEVREDTLRAVPVYWGAEQKGMQSGEELTDEYGDLREVKEVWRTVAHFGTRIGRYVSSMANLTITPTSTPSMNERSPLPVVPASATRASRLASVRRSKKT